MAAKTARPATAVKATATVAPLPCWPPAPPLKNRNSPPMLLYKLEDETLLSIGREERERKKNLVCTTMADFFYRSYCFVLFCTDDGNFKKMTKFWVDFVVFYFLSLLCLKVCDFLFVCSIEERE